MHARSFAAALTFAFTLSVFLANAARADNFRCGSRIVYEGDSSENVRAKCGEPADIAFQSVLQRPSYVRNGRLHYFGNELVDVPVEIWTYNFGPNKLMRRLRFVDGWLKSVETLGYGYHPVD